MNINQELKGKKVLITGASKGLGREIAISFEKLGCTLFLCARDKKLLNDLNFIFSDKSECHFFNLDLLDDIEREKMLNEIEKNFENPDIIIHCLGGSLGFNNPEDDLENYLKSIKGNLGVAIDINNKFIPVFKKKKIGNIIHISSVVAKQATASVPYVTAKSSISAYVRTIGNYLAEHNVIISGILPGAFIAENNAMARFKRFKPNEYKDFVNKLPLKRMPHAKEYIEIIKLLSSRQSQIFSGSMIPLDTGQGISII